MLGALSERDTFFMLQVWKDIGISWIKVYEGVDCLSFRSLKRLTEENCYWKVLKKTNWFVIPLLLVFSVTPFKIDQNKNQNRSIDKVQNLGNERRYIYKDPRQDSGQRNISYTRYPKKCFTQTYRDLYGDAMLVLTWMSSNMADGN